MFSFTILKYGCGRSAQKGAHFFQAVSTTLQKLLLKKVNDSVADPGGRCKPTDLLGLFCQSIGITKTHDHHKFTKIEYRYFFSFLIVIRMWLNYDQPQSPPAPDSLSRSMILVTQASRISLCLALARLGLREDMPLIKETHSMHKIRMRASQTSTVSKVCQEQCLSSDLHTCLIVPPQTMNGLPSNSTGSSPAVSRRREVAFRSPRNTSAGAYVKTKAEITRTTTAAFGPG